MNRPPVASEMIDYISARVFAGNYRPGSRIPSVRALMRRFNLSYGSALNGISYLCERGLLEKHPKSGVTVSSDPHAQQPAGGCCIGVITSNGTLDNNPGLVYHALSEIQRNALEQDISLIAASGVFDTLSPVLEHCQAVIVMVELDARCERLPFSAPAVGIFQADDFGGQMSIVDIDPYTTAKQAVDFFRRRRPEKSHGPDRSRGGLPSPRPDFRVPVARKRRGERRDSGFAVRRSRRLCIPAGGGVFIHLGSSSAALCRSLAGCMRRFAGAAFLPARHRRQESDGA